MSKELIGILSGFIVFLSAIPYGIRAWQGKTEHNIVSWSLWSFVSLVILLTWKSSGAKSNIMPAVASLISTSLIFLIILLKERYNKEIHKSDKVCFSLGLIALVGWSFVKCELHDDPFYAQWALYLGISADLIAAIPNIIWVWGSPDKERPFAWTMYAFGYGLSFFAVSEMTFANCLPPIYMFLGAGAIAFPLIRFRVKNKIPLREWT